MTAMSIFLGAILFSLPAVAGQGIGGRNGGSGYDCGDGAITVADEHARTDARTRPPIEDRATFISAATSRIEDPLFRSLLLRNWARYGDSERWPIAAFKDFEVYYYLAPSIRIPYDARGMIQAPEANEPACAHPSTRNPFLCCDRVLISHFSPSDATPTRVQGVYERLDRYQRNVLELHEAVYRTAWDLGQYPNPNPNPLTWNQIRLFQSMHKMGDFPATWVESIVSILLSDGLTLTHDALAYYWDWSNGLYMTLPSPPGRAGAEDRPL